MYVNNDSSIRRYILKNLICKMFWWESNLKISFYLTVINSSLWITSKTVENIKDCDAC